MAIKKILVWPNPELSRIAKPVEHLDAALKTLIEDLFDTMAAGQGIGLAATQIGVHQRVIVMDIYPPDGSAGTRFWGALINPEIQDTNEESIVAKEGCLSVPGQFGMIKRPLSVKVKYIDPHGEHIINEFKDLAARCVLHEIDHLNGETFVQYLGQASRDLIRGKMKKIGSSYLPGQEIPTSKKM